MQNLTIGNRNDGMDC